MKQLAGIVVVFGSSFLATGSSWGTAQIGEYLEYEGKRIEIYSTPLEPYLSAMKDPPRFDSTCTACWRGYVGVWRIDDGQLMLVSLHNDVWERDGSFRLGEKIPIVPLSKDWARPVPATWYSDVLRIPEGERLRYVHIGFGSTYERERYITIKDGKVVATRVVDNSGYGATRSSSDLEWVALSPEPVEDKGEWVDARVLSPEDGDEVTTRGIFWGGDKTRPARLWIPITPTTGRVDLQLAAIPDEPGISGGSHVEIVAKFRKATGDYAVSKIRALEPGQTIHHPSFEVPVVEGKKKDRKKRSRPFGRKR